MIMSGIMNAVFIAVLSYQFKIYGYMSAIILSFAFNVIYIAAHKPFALSRRWKPSLLPGLVKFGLPLMVLGLAETLFMTIDKVMILSFLGFASAGLYGTAILASQYIATFQNSILTVLMPNFHEKFGENENPQDLKPYVCQSAVGFCDLLPTVIATAWFFAPPVIQAVLPQFVNCIPAMQILLISTFFLCLAQLHGLFLVSTKKHIVLVPLFIVASLVAVFLNYHVIQLDLGIAGVAAATVITLAIRWGATYWLAMRHLMKFREMATDFSALMIRIIWAVAGLLIVTRYCSGLTSWAQASLGFMIFTVLQGPFLVHLNKRFHVIGHLKDKWKGR